MKKLQLKPSEESFRVDEVISDDYGVVHIEEPSDEKYKENDSFIFNAF